MPNTKMRDYAKKKPIAITADGTFLYPTNLEGVAALGIGSLDQLETPLQQKLTLERVKLDPSYDLGIIGLAHVKKDEVIRNVEELTTLGCTVIQAEMAYCNEFIATDGGATLATEMKSPEWPEQEWVIPPWKKGKKIKLWVKSTAVFCENTTDAVTRPAALYRIAHVHPVFVAKGFNVVSLEDANDVRANFVGPAKGAFSNYISGIGHGSPTVYTGHLGDHILEVGAYDAAEVKATVIHLLSCQTAKKLGPDVVAKGATAYAGYFENFTFVWDDPATGVNEQELFWKCDSTFDIYMANGATAAAAYEATIAAYNAAIASVPGTSAATWLTWDRNYLRSPVIHAMYGSVDATAPSATAVWVVIPFEMADLKPEAKTK